MNEVGTIGVFAIALIVGAVVSVIAAANRFPSFGTKLQQWQPLIASAIAFSGVLGALVLNASYQDVTRDRKQKAIEHALLAELHRHLLSVEARTDGLIQRIKEKGLASGKFDIDDCELVVHLSKTAVARQPILYPEARKELLEMDPKLLEFLVDAYEEASMQVATWAHTNVEGCQKGLFGDFLPVMEASHKRVAELRQDASARLERSAQAVERR